MLKVRVGMGWSGLVWQPLHSWSPEFHSDPQCCLGCALCHICRTSWCGRAARLRC